jgi:hypothetical protein
MNQRCELCSGEFTFDRILTVHIKDKDSGYALVHYLCRSCSNEVFKAESVAGWGR